MSFNKPPFTTTLKRSYAEILAERAAKKTAMAAPMAAPMAAIVAPVAKSCYDTEEEDDEKLVEVALDTKYNTAILPSYEFVCESDQDEEGGVAVVRVAKKNVVVEKPQHKFLFDNVYDEIQSENLMPGNGILELSTQFLTMRDTVRSDIATATFTDTLVGFEMVSSIGVKVEVFENQSSTMLPLLVATNFGELIKAKKLRHEKNEYSCNTHALTVVGVIGYDNFELRGCVHEESPDTAKFGTLGCYKHLLQVIHAFMFPVV